MKKQDVSRDTTQEEEFYLKPFDQLDNTLFNFTQELQDPYCDDHKALYRTETNQEPNVRQSQKHLLRKKTSFANKDSSDDDGSSSCSKMNTDQSVEEDQFAALPKRRQSMFNRAITSIVPKSPKANSKKNQVSSDLEKKQNRMSIEERKAETEVLKEELDIPVVKSANPLKRRIDFNDHMEELQNRTEIMLPYTLTQCEDAMYLDRNNVVTLEYHYYQKNCSYTYLSRKKEHWVNQDNACKLFDTETNAAVTNKLGTQNYLSQTDDSDQRMVASHYDRQNMCNLYDDGIDALERMNSHPDVNDFMKIKTKPDQLKSKDEIQQAQRRPSYKKQKTLMRQTSKHIRSVEEREVTNMLCPVIAIYKVTNDGKMQKSQEVDVKMGGYFNRSQHGNMELTRSLDQKLISLCNFDSSNPKQHFFNVKAWNWKHLQPHGHSQHLNSGLNHFYLKNKDSFDHLESVHFMGRNEYIQLMYVEKRPRQFKEKQKYEVDINTKITKSSLKKHLEQPSYIRRSDPRKARKYVFFEVKTGKVVLEYGGVHVPMTAEKKIENKEGSTQKQKTENIELFELGLIVEETVKRGFETKLNFLVTGDYLPDDIKEKNLIFKWGLCQVNIDFFHLLEKFDTPYDREEEIKRQIREIPQHYNYYNDDKNKVKILSHRTLVDKTQKQKTGLASEKSIDLKKLFKDKLSEKVRNVESDYNYFEYDQHNIENQLYDWEINITVSSNKQRDQFAIISSPDQNGYNSNATYYVNGKAFKKSSAYYVKIPNDSYIEHGRNSFIKSEMFYNIWSNSIYESSYKTYCLRLKDSGGQKVTEFNIPIEDSISEFDQWLHQKKEITDAQVTDIFQTISVKKGDQYANLQTRIPKSYIGSEPTSYEVVQRRSDTSNVQQSNHPFIAYNLGLKKICFMNIDQRGEGKKKAFILNMEEDEQFVGFADFYNYNEIGFVPNDLRIECCTPFLYMTRRLDKQFDRFSNHLNLILLDPFCDQLEAVVFMSNTVFDNDIFNNSDMLIKSIIQNNRSNRMDEDYNIYIWTQVQNKLIRSKMLVQNTNVVAEDSDVLEGGPADSSMRAKEKIEIQDLLIISDQKQFIYYIVKQNGECKIMEGNPRDPYIKNHECIFSIKSSKILSFGYECGSFYIMDDEHTTRKLSRNESQRMLSVINVVRLKEIQRLDYTPKKFDNCIIREMYGIFSSKIFYFYDIDGEPFPQGILEAEDLHPKKTEQGVELQRGPSQFGHSNRFYLLYREKNFNSFLKVHILPDQTQRTLINDFQNYVDLSTFLNNEQILCKIRRRYLIFSKDGNFINEISFDNTNIKVLQKSKKEKDGDSDDERIMSIKYLKAKQERRLKSQKVSHKYKEVQPIQDFQGNPYKIVDDEHASEISDYNKMKLIQFSQNIKFFLFYDIKEMRMILYEMIMPNESSSWAKLDQNEKIQQKMNYSFQAKYELDVNSSDLFKNVYQTSTDLMQHFYKNENQVHVDNEGRVKMFYVISHDHAKGKHQDGEQENEEHEEKPITFLQECQIYGSIFQQEIRNEGGQAKAKSKSICYGFMETVTFPIQQAKRARQKLIEEQKKEVNMKINNIRINQSRLPKNLHDYTEYDKFIKDLKVLEQMEFSNFNCNIFHQNLLVVSCGNYLMYGYLEKAPPKEPGGVLQRQYRLKKASRRGLDSTVEEMSKWGQKDDLDKLQGIACDFADSVQILKILETSRNNCLQIVAKDLETSLLFVITWDFERNIEINGFQIKEQKFNASSVGNHIIKGLNNKMNYLMNQHHFIDLEHNIPIKQKNVDQGLDSMVRYWNQLRNIEQFTNQKKSNYKNDQILGIEKSNCLYYNLSRIDVLLWKDIQQNGETREIIEKSIQLMDFNLVFDSCSLFHYFADKPDIIEFIQHLISETALHRTLTIQEETLPLQILNQDTGLKSAVFRSLDMQSPKSFEIMVELIKDFPETCVSKLLLKSLYYVISHPADSVIDFFDRIIYKPPQMQTSHMINYDEDRYGDDVIFSSHTSIVTKKLIDLKLKEKFSDYEQIKDEAKPKNVSVVENCGEEFLEMKLHRKFDETNNEEDDDSKPPQRVSIEALDLDWLFANNNGKRFIELLVAENANVSVLGQKSVKVFIDLLWQEYQPKIIHRILIPYLTYMLLMAILTGNTVDEWAENKAQRLLHPTDETVIKLDFWITLRAYIFTGISMLIMMSFAALEITQMWKSESLSDYFADFWNCIDVLSISLNYVFLVMFLINLIIKESYFTHNLILDIGSWSMFFMWIKVFYWFRLFATYAKYIKLIIQTITDMRYFFAMVLIIMVSFGNFMYVANNTLEESGDTYISRQYVPKEFNFVNSVLSVYMFGALGQFSQSTYIAGYAKYSASAMFILGTFLVSVVFMNMLIAIMSDTFADVESNQEINTLREQISMISDYEWLVDLQQSFKDQKYVIRVAPYSGHMKDKDLVLDAINDFQTYLGKQIDATNLEVIKRIDYVEANNKFQLNHQLDNILMMSKKLQELEFFSKKTEAGTDQKDIGDRLNGALVRAMQTDVSTLEKVEFGKVIKKKFAGQSDTSDARIHEITMDMLQRIDLDHSGQIDYEEFYEFFANNDEFVVSNENIKNMFLEFDKDDKDNEATINIEEFAQAIKSALTYARDQTDDDSSHKKSNPDSEGYGDGSEVISEYEDASSNE